MTSNGHRTEMQLNILKFTVYPFTKNNYLAPNSVVQNHIKTPQEKKLQTNMNMDIKILKKYKQMESNNIKDYTS